jgi:hypothetical protein
LIHGHSEGGIDARRRKLILPSRLVRRWLAVRFKPGLVLIDISKDEYDSKENNDGNGDRR